MFFSISYLCFITAYICFFIIYCWICLIAIPTYIVLAWFDFKLSKRSFNFVVISGCFYWSWLIIWVSICIWIIFCCYGFGWAIWGIIFWALRAMCCCIFIPTLCWIWKSFNPCPSVYLITSSLNFFCNLYISIIRGSSLFIMEITLSLQGWEGIWGTK